MAFEIFAQPWQNFILTIILVVVLSELFLWILRSMIRRLAAKTKSDLDDIILARTHYPIIFAVVIFGMKFAIQSYDLGAYYMGIAQTIIDTLSYLIIIYLVIIISDILFSKFRKRYSVRSKNNMQVVDLLHRSSSVIIGTVGLLIILAAWGVQITPLLASLGVAGLAVAFALQKTLGNVFGGISLILDKNIRTGDVIDIGDGALGTVLDIGLRSTKMRTFDNEVLIIPNGNLTESRLKNISQPNPSVRVVLSFGVAYGSDVDKVKKLVLKEIKKLPYLDESKEIYVRFMEMSDSALSFKVFFFIKNYDEIYTARDDVNTAIYKTLNKNKISIPFPQMDIHLKKN